MVEEFIEKKPISFNSENVGWDCSQVATKTDKIYYLKNVAEPVALISGLPKFSKSEKGLYAALLNYLKDLPLENLESDVKRYVKEYCEDNKIILDDEQVNKILTMLIQELNGFGPITTLLNDKDTIEEIAIFGIGVDKPVHIYISGNGWVKTNLFFTDEDYLKELINRLARGIGRRLTLTTPILNAALEDGSRLSAVAEPISNLPLATIRRYKYNPLTPLDLINYKTISKEIALFLWLVLQTDSNIVICGNTGSGKTTTLNAMFSFVPSSERIIVVEETPEINIPHNHKLSLCVDESLGISMTDLITSTLRMRPDRLVVGEVRAHDEVQAFINTVLAGQGKGSFATFHALSARECIQRLIKLGVEDADINAIDLIIVQRRWNSYDLKKGTKKEMRKIISISEIDEGKVREIYSYDYETDSWSYSESKRMKAKLEKVFNAKYDQIIKAYDKKISELVAENEKHKSTMQSFFDKINVIK